MKVYIVAKVGYDYNDEYYHTGNYGTSYEEISDAFRSVEEAKAAQKKNTVEFIKSDIVGSWDGEGFHAYSEDREIGNVTPEFIQRLFPDRDYNDEWDMTVPGTATEEQIEAIAKALGDEFFEVLEIEVE